MDVNPKQLVEAGYDQMAEQYLASKDPNDEVLLGNLKALAHLLPPHASVLELGCGAGVSATQWLAAQGFQVTGVDVSARQLELAEQHVPTATFIKGDMTAVDFPHEAFYAVASFYAIIHVSRTEQNTLLESIHGWLKPGGYFLANWAISEWEGQEEDWQGWGATMWWSHFDKESNVAMLRDTGFAIVSAEVEATGGESWLWVLARK